MAVRQEGQCLHGKEDKEIESVLIMSLGSCFIHIAYAHGTYTNLLRYDLVYIPVKIIGRSQ